MISDESGRYVATVRPGFILWRYDRRWRGIDELDLSTLDGVPVYAAEGRHHLLLVLRAPSGELQASVHDAGDLRNRRATARYSPETAWSFDGEKELWASVPEYIVVPPSESDESAALLRIADDAHLDDVDGLAGMQRVQHVPNSRLVVITTPGAFTVYDPIAHRAVRHYELAGGNADPLVQFRNDDELWIDDGDSMLKIDSRRFEVIDAAGSDVSAVTDVPDGQGVIGGWQFAAGNELCIVARPNVGDVLALDAISMLPVARATFGTRSPLAATLLGRNSVLAVDADGRPHRARLRRVRIRFEDGPPSIGDSSPNGSV